MNQKTVTIEIDAYGNCAIDLVGFQGKSCDVVAKALRSGDVVVKSRFKPKAYIHAAAQQGRPQRAR